MAFAILRMDKIKSFGNAGGLNEHLERTMEVPNSNPEKTHLNERIIGSGNLEVDIKARIEENGCNVRKNAVLAVQFVMTASPEFFDKTAPDFENKVESFKKLSEEFLKKEFGEKNVVNLTLHMDETTPHLHAVVVPIDGKGKLNAREFINGRDKLSKLQDSFAEKMKVIGLERGLKGSKAEHTEIKQFYELTKEAVSIQKAPDDKIKLDRPNPMERVNIDTWLTKQEEKINKQVSEIKDFYEKKSMVSNFETINKTLQLREQKLLSDKLEKSEKKQTEIIIKNVVDKYNKKLHETTEKIIEPLKLENKNLKEENVKLKENNIKITEIVKNNNNKVEKFEEFLKKNNKQFNYQNSKLEDITISKQHKQKL